MTGRSYVSRHQDLDPRYVAARRVLLDALTVLAPHGDAIIPGRCPGRLPPHGHRRPGHRSLHHRRRSRTGPATPRRGSGARSRDVHRRVPSSAAPGGHVEPGIWLASASAAGEEFLVPVDLIVPEGAASGTGRRAARLGGHGARAARRAVGLEAALFDNSTMTIAALDPADERSLQARVAGPAALLVAKAHKLHDRVASDRAARLNDKDASDVVRLMQTTKSDEIAVTLNALAQDAVAGPPTTAALIYIEELFGRRGRPGIEMASRALRTAIPEDRVQAICVAYVTALVP